MNNKNILLQWPVLVMLLISLLIIVIAAMPIPFLDDLCLLERYRANNSVFEVCKYMYNEREGRFASITGLAQISGFKYLGLSLTSIFWAIFFLLSIYLIARLNKQIHNKSDLFRQLVVLFPLTLISVEPVLHEVVFWTTGGAYSLGLLLSLFFIVIFELEAKFFYLILLAGIISTIGPNFTIPLVVIVFIKSFYALFWNKDKSFSYSLFQILTILIIFSIGMYILTSAPGTQKRLSTISTYFNWHPRYIIEIVTKTTYTAFSYFWISIPLVLISIFSKIDDFINLVSKKNRFNQCINLIVDFRYFIAAMASVLMFIKIPGVFSQRAALFFVILLLIQSYMLGKSFYENKTVLLVSKIANVIIMVLFAYTTIAYSKIYFNYWNDVSSKNISNNSIYDNYTYPEINLPFKHHAAQVKSADNKWQEECMERFRSKVYGIENQ